MVRFALLLLLVVVSAKADLVLWSPAGQNLTYILPEGLNPQSYIQNLKAEPALAPFVEKMVYSDQDRVVTVKPDSENSSERVLLVANKIEDHERAHPRINNFGRHFSGIFVFPVGTALETESFTRREIL